MPNQSRINYYYLKTISVTNVEQSYPLHHSTNIEQAREEAKHMLDKLISVRLARIDEVSTTNYALPLGK